MTGKRANRSGWVCGLGLAVLGASAAAAPVTLVNDDFGTVTHPSGFRTVAVAPGVRFNTRDPGTAAIVNDTGLGSAALNVLDTDSDTTTSMAVLASLPQAINLNQVGDAATLSFRFRYTTNASAAAGGNNFRFGFHSSNDTPVTVDNTTESDNDIGYYAAIGSGGTVPATNSIFFEETGGTGRILGGLDRTAINASSATGLGLNDNLPHTASLTLTRTAGGVQLALSVDGAAAITGTDTSGLRTSFDQISFGGGFAATGNGEVLDDVVVTYDAVPEPGALALLGLIGAVGFRRRKR
jgi:hypothetical protein